MSQTPPKIVTVIQARTGSTRLPNKIMLPLGGKPLLVRMVERVQRASLAGTVVVATTTDPSDDVIVEACEAAGFRCYRGKVDDLLDRHYQVGLQYQADAVVKIPSDKPLIDPDVIDRVLGFFSDHFPTYDFVSNLHPETYPYGNDVEVVSMAAMKIAWQEATDPLAREHATPFFWENPERFRIANVEWETGLDYSKTYRYTIDYPEDYEMITRVFDRLHPQNPHFGMADILALLEQEPALAAINRMHIDAKWYNRPGVQLKHKPTPKSSSPKGT